MTTPDVPRDAAPAIKRGVGIVVTVDLSNGQRVTLDVSADPATLTDEERELVLSLIAKALAVGAG